MAKTAAVAAATPMDLIWNDGVVPTWLAGMTVGFILLFPILKALFPKTVKERGAFLLAFELVALFPVRTRSRARLHHPRVPFRVANASRGRARDARPAPTRPNPRRDVGRRTR